MNSQINVHITKYHSSKAAEYARIYQGCDFVVSADYASQLESERDALIQNRDEWRNLAKMLAQLQFDEFHAGGEALIDQHNAARELYERLSEVER